MDPLLTYNNRTGDLNMFLGKKSDMASSKVHRICDTFVSTLHLIKRIKIPYQPGPVNAG